MKSRIFRHLYEIITLLALVALILQFEEVTAIAGQQGAAKSTRAAMQEVPQNLKVVNL